MVEPTLIARADALSQAAQRFGTPCYVYFPDIIRERVGRIRSAFGSGVAISYAVKANPNGAVLRLMRGVVDGLDVSSGGELDRGLSAGFSASDISFTGPAKRRAELQRAVDTGAEVIVESVAEASELASLVAAPHPILVRITPARVPRGFGLPMAGRPTAFGIDEEDLEPALAAIMSLPNLHVVGFHAYSGTQCLRPEAIVENYAIFLGLFERAARIVGPPRKLVLGAGLGIPLHDGDTALDLDAVALGLGHLLDGIAEPLANARVWLETGRYLVGPAGWYLTRVVRAKRSRGAEIRLCDGGLNHHLAAAGLFGSVLHRNYPIAVLGKLDHPPAGTYDLNGPLCTPIDRLGQGVSLPEVEVGDVVAIGCSGAYGYSASPRGFISHPPPRELVAQGEPGSYRLEDATAP